LRDTLIALFQAFTDTNNRSHSSRDDCMTLLSDHRIGLKVELPALRVTDYNVPSPHVFQHECRDFTSMGTFLRFSGTVLASYGDVGSFKPVRDCFDCGEDRCDDDLAVICIRYQRLQSENGFHRFAQRLVHFPVSGNDRFAHHDRP
jgi:hypothetical protein